MDGRIEWTPPCILCTFQHPESLWNHLWCCCCKIGPHLYPCKLSRDFSLVVWLSWLLVPAVNCFLSFIPSSRVSHTHLLPFPATFWKAPSCSFSRLQSLPGHGYIFLEHFMVTIASCFYFFNYLLIFFQ